VASLRNVSVTRSRLDAAVATALSLRRKQSQFHRALQCGTGGGTGTVVSIFFCLVWYVWWWARNVCECSHFLHIRMRVMSLLLMFLFSFIFYCYIFYCYYHIYKYRTPTLFRRCGYALYRDRLEAVQQDKSEAILAVLQIIMSGLIYHGCSVLEPSFPLCTNRMQFDLTATL